MRMIPPVIDVNAPSGEKEIFQLLKETNSKKFKDCLVFHSLNYPQGTEKNKKQSYEFFGESDFVILVPSRGLINIEVKGGKISREDGIWYTNNRFGKHKIKDPFKQATNSLFKIGGYLKTKDILIPQDYLVIFPDCEFDTTGIEISDQNLVSGEINPKLLNTLNNIIENHLIEANGRFHPKESDLNQIIKVLRPNFISNLSSKNLLNQSRKQIDKFTNEQIKILESYNSNRLIVTGGQGTGKTIIAEEIAKKRLLEGSVLFISSGRLRNEETKIRFKDFDNFHCFTFHNFISKIMKDIIKKEIPKELSDKINSLKFEDRTEFFLKFISNTILEADNLKKYDFLIMDEMQNYCHYDEFYGVFGSIIKGDLNEGKWYFFGDFDYQNLWSKSISDEIKKKNPKLYLRDLNHETHQLTYNVRNAQQIVVHSPFLSGVAKEKLPSRPFIIKIEGQIKHYFENSVKHKIERLEKIIEDLKKQNIDGNEIVILSSNRIDNPKNYISSSNIANFFKIIDLTQISKFGIDIIKSDEKNCIYFSTSHAFQGMESKIIILTDPLTSPIENHKINEADYSNSKDLKNLITYNAMGRANTFLYVIWDKIHEKYVNQQIGKALKIQDEVSF
tara:strand:+ start:3026 stop:4876 length:1851 start_codon:yes stop_codon:yes gene_type:complete